MLLARVRRIVRVDPRTIGQTSVGPRARPIDPQAQWSKDALDQMYDGLGYKLLRNRSSCPSVNQSGDRR